MPASSLSPISSNLPISQLLSIAWIRSDDADAVSSPRSGDGSAVRLRKGLQMFDTGMNYKITTLVSSGNAWDEECEVWTVTAVEGTLIKLSNPFSKDKIVDIASWNFVGAEIAE